MFKDGILITGFTNLSLENIPLGVQHALRSCNTRGFIRLALGAVRKSNWTQKPPSYTIEMIRKSSLGKVEVCSLRNSDASVLLCFKYFHLQENLLRLEKCFP